jgi:hypothetical protein
MPYCTAIPFTIEYNQIRKNAVKVNITLLCKDNAAVG